MASCCDDPQPLKIIMYALPGVYYDNCHELSGTATWPLDLGAPFTGSMMTRDPGIFGYLSALWAFLTNRGIYE